MASFIGRRRFLATLGSSAVAWTLPARAQQPMPVVGFLNSSTPDGYALFVAAFRQGLKETGYVEGRNVAIEYRWAEGRIDRLPALAADLVQRRVAVIAATTAPAVIAAKAATAIIPVVFETAVDPIQLGLVASLNRPGGNITGVVNLNSEITPKRLELLRELVPTASVVGLLINPANPVLGEPVARASQAAARTLGVNLHVLNASSEGDFEQVFASLIQLRAGGLVIGADAFFTARSRQLAALALHHAVPTVHQNREFVAAGGLASYGGVTSDAYRLTGVYAGRILNGEKPADLPVQQGTKVELYINMKTARALGVTIPLALSGRADEIFD
jgi:putative ABC transport system substrate-binding protein